MAAGTNCQALGGLEQVSATVCCGITWLKPECGEELAIAASLSHSRIFFSVRVAYLVTKYRYDPWKYSLGVAYLMVQN